VSLRDLAKRRWRETKRREAIAEQFLAAFFIGIAAATAVAAIFIGVLK
jgi:hypothetical protein